MSLSNADFGEGKTALDWLWAIGDAYEWSLTAQDADDQRAAARALNEALMPFVHGPNDDPIQYFFRLLKSFRSKSRSETHKALIQVASEACRGDRFLLVDLFSEASRHCVLNAQPVASLQRFLLRALSSAETASRYEDNLLAPVTWVVESLNREDLVSVLDDWTDSPGWRPAFAWAVLTSAGGWKTRPNLSAILVHQQLFLARYLQDLSKAGRRSALTTLVNQIGFSTFAKALVSCAPEQIVDLLQILFKEGEPMGVDVLEGEAARRVTPGSDGIGLKFFGKQAALPPPTPKAGRKVSWQHDAMVQIDLLEVKVGKNPNVSVDEWRATEDFDVLLESVVSGGQTDSRTPT